MKPVRWTVEERSFIGISNSEDSTAEVRGLIVEVSVYETKASRPCICIVEPG